MAIVEYKCGQLVVVAAPPSSSNGDECDSQYEKHGQWRNVCVTPDRQTCCQKGEGDANHPHDGVLHFNLSIHFTSYASGPTMNRVLPRS